jgi:hypothetical protein
MSNATHVGKYIEGTGKETTAIHRERLATFAPVMTKS